MWGSAIGGCFAYSHMLGGYAGSHADYIRVPYADQGAFGVPDGVSDLAALFASDAAPTGWTGADGAGITPGDTVAVWGAGGSGKWPRAPRCSWAPNRSSSSTGSPNASTRSTSTSAPTRWTTPRTTSWSSSRNAPVVAAPTW